MKTAVKERPILFSGEMVRAILDGRKTLTRRVIKPQPERGMSIQPCPYVGYSINEADGGCRCGAIHCPYGVPGDRLWVRETWMPLWDSGAGFYTCLIPTGRENKWDIVKYRADGERPHNFGANWKPAIHMPRRASRITLEVAAVRVERLQEITEADAEREGCLGERWATGHGDYSEIAPSEQFRDLWDRINGNRDGCSWESNPWVWVVEFRQVKETP